MKPPRACELHSGRNAYAQLVQAAGPLAYWPLRDDVLDASGNNHHGVVQGRAEWRREAGGWLQLDGQSWVQVASAPEFSLPNQRLGLSVEVWVRFARLDFGVDYIHWLGKGGAGSYEWGLRCYRDDHPQRPSRLSAYVWNPEGGCGAGAFFQEPLPRDQWRHLVACFQPGDALTAPESGVLIYVNGQLRQYPARDPATRYAHPPHWMVTPRAGCSPLRLGARSDSAHGLPGGLAEVALYPGLLGADVVAAHYAAAAPCWSELQ